MIDLLMFDLYMFNISDIQSFLKLNCLINFLHLGHRVFDVSYKN